jgi:predicted DsbA family dithiol-disulfide isomerase
MLRNSAIIVGRSSKALSGAMFRRMGLVVVGCTWLGAGMGAQQPPPAQVDPPLATLEGNPIDESQFAAGEKAQLERMRQQTYGVQTRALHEVIDQQLVDAEAKRKGVSVEDLVRTEVISKVAEPTDEQLKASYESRQDLNTQPFEDVKDKIRTQLKEAEIQRARTQFIAALWLQAVNHGTLKILLTPPHLDLPVDPSRLRGDQQAPVTIVEFSDFSCPSCRRAESILAEVLAKYPGKVKLSYRDFALIESNPGAEIAAEASRCAGEQSKYWEYHDWLFANPDKQTRDGLLAAAHTIGLNDMQFAACLDKGRFRTKVDQDFQLGTHIGVTSAPGIFINGKFISSTQPAAAIEKAIDQELSSTSRPSRN